MGKILITPRSLTKEGHPALERLKKAGHQLVTCTPGKMPDEAELLALLPGCAGYLAGVEKVSARVLEAARGLKVISRNGAGIDNVDLEAARRLNIQVRPAPGANARGVAELAIALIFSLLRSLPWSDGQLKRRSWNRRLGLEVAGRTLGLVGCGNIGRMVVELAAGLGLKTMAFRRHPDPSFAPPRFRWVSLEELYAGSDIISLHCPAGPRPVIDREAIARMRRGVYLVNTARADVVEEQAVLEALASGQIAGFATDVFAQEPPKDWRLAGHERVIATPHIGGYTEESVSRATEEAVRNLLEVL
jgi:phosphoglycerate dehydrogenase-like enzyme